MESFSSIEIKRELRPCLVDGEPALFHMWEERSDIIKPSPLVGGHNGGILRYTLGVVEMENGQVRQVAPCEIQFTDQKVKEYCFEPEGSSKNIEAIIYHYCCEGCSACANCYETGRQKECEYYMEQYNWLTNGSSEEVQSE